MKRLAILIGSPSDPSTPESGTYLAGVETDIGNIYRFLKSSLGGSWLEDEIKQFFPNPSFEEVEPYLKECEEKDFSFVYFSGHGGTDKKNNNPRVQFKYNDNPHVKDLAYRAERQVTIIDACRGYSSYRNADDTLGRILFPNVNPMFSRNRYNKCLAEIPKNRKALLFASQHNQDSMDIGSKGGLFSINLLETVLKMGKYNKADILNIEQVFNETFKSMRNEVHQPDLKLNPSDSHKLPFAVKVNTQSNKHTKSLITVEKISKIALITLLTLGVYYFVKSIRKGRKLK